MLRNPLYRYGNENGRVPAHLNVAKEWYDSMVKNKDIIALTKFLIEERNYKYFGSKESYLQIKMLKNKLYLYGDDEIRVPAHLNFGKEAFDNMVKNKDTIALINAETGEQKSYGEVAQMTADIALSLTRMGVRKGDVVCVCSLKNFEFLPTVMGIICAGATFSAMDPTYGSFPLLHRLKIARPKVMFCSLSAYETHKATFEEVGSIQQYIIYGDETRDGAVLFQEFLTETTTLENFLPVPVNGWEDVAFILYSSGTTGLPKGVPFTHYGFLTDYKQLVSVLSNGVRVYNCGEFFSAYVVVYLLGCMAVNATLVYQPSCGEKNMLEAVQKYKVQVLKIPPTAAIALATSAILDKYDVSSVEYMNAPGIYVREEDVQQIKQRFPNLVSVIRQYGMTEVGLISHEQFATKGYRDGSSGTVANGVVLKVVDLETRKPLGPNQRGEICMKGHGLVKGYSNNVVPDFKDEEGFLKTGDMGYYDEDGYIYIINRIKEMIKYNAIAIAPAEFELLLLQHPSVREAGVVGKPHPKHGEAPVAFIVLQPGCTATEEELVEFLHSRITPSTRLAGGVRFVERLPRGALDKLDRKELLKRLLDED